MKEFIAYILQFGNLNSQQIELVSKKAKEIELRKDEYFVEAGKTLKQVGFVVEGVFRICYYNNKGEEITRYFIDENHLLLNPYHNEPLSEYVQAATDCRIIIFPNSDWEEISNTIRSEEHTSELQSRFDLVCRLLLE